MPPTSSAAATAEIAARDEDVKRIVSGEVDLTPPLGEDDDAVVERLSTVRGIGPWTAQIHLMFELRRLGVRQGWAAIKGLATPPRPKELHTLGEPFRPYRTVPAWYCSQAAFLKQGGTDISLR